MKKDQILNRLDAIAGRMQELDVMDDWKESDMHEWNALCFEHDTLMASIKEAA